MYLFYILASDSPEQTQLTPVTELVREHTPPKDPEVENVTPLEKKDDPESDSDDTTVVKSSTSPENSGHDDPTPKKVRFEDDQTNSINQTVVDQVLPNPLQERKGWIAQWALSAYYGEIPLFETAKVFFLGVFFALFVQNYYFTSSPTCPPKA